MKKFFNSIIFKNSYCKSHSGITLIALIITIIVLLILAGVTINAITGSENAMEKAQKADEENDKGAMRDAATLIATDFIQDYYTTVYANDDSNLKAQFPNEGAYVIAHFPSVEESDFTYSISEDILTVTNKRGLSVSGTIVNDGRIIWDNDEPVEYIIPNELSIDNPDGTYKKIYVNYTFPGNTTPTPCIVLYNDDQHGLQIITVNPISTITLGRADPNYTSLSTQLERSQNSYQNVVSNLNKAALDLVEGDTKVADARCVGSLPDANESKTSLYRKNEQIKYVTQNNTTSQVNVSYFNKNDNFTTNYDNQYWDTDENYLEDETRLQALNAYGLTVNNPRFLLVSL